jgi:hypothetical protein
MSAFTTIDIGGRVMRYSWDQGVDKHPESVSRSLIVGLPVVFAAVFLGPMKLGHNPVNTPQTTTHNTTTALKQPFNLRSSGATATTASFSTPSGHGTDYTGGSASNSSSSTGSSTPGNTSAPTNSGSASTTTGGTSTTPSGGGMGGGSGDSGSTSSGPIPTTPITVPGQSVTVDGKTIVSTSGLTLTLN